MPNTIALNHPHDHGDGDADFGNTPPKSITRKLIRDYPLEIKPRFEKSNV